MPGRFLSNNMIELLYSVLKIPLARQILILLTILAIVGGIIAVLTRQKNAAIKRATEERLERERIERQAEGLRIVLGAGNTAAETDRLRETANAQNKNSSGANSAFDNSVRSDSSGFSGNFNAVRERFCKHFPDDLECRRR